MPAVVSETGCEAAPGSVVTTTVTSICATITDSSNVEDGTAAKEDRPDLQPAATNV